MRVYTKSDMAHYRGEHEKWILISDMRTVVDLGFSIATRVSIVLSACDGIA